ncbi:MAG: phosphoserine phosphatase SerB [Rhodovibrionaceae bacterium]
MASVLTLIADPAKRNLSAAQAAAVAEALKAETPVWLAEDLACDIFFADGDLAAAETRARAALDGAPLDLAAQPAEGRRKRLLVADMESTIIQQEMLDELAATLGLRAEMAEITARTMAGELDFEASLQARVARLEGLPLARLEETAEDMTFMPGARTLIATLRAQGCVTALVSGGFTSFAELVAEACGFDHVQANRLLDDGKALTGRVAEPILGREAKLAALRDFAAEIGCELKRTAAVGDGANDLAMLEAAGLGVAFRAKPRVRAAARFRIDHGDLTALLYLQGIAEEDFREA